MGVDAEVLILGPFREVAERGKEAITNAQDVHDDDAENERAKYMLKAAQAVAKEGERALKRLQPLWDGQVGKYGATFTDALIQNDDIETKRHQLDDLLYDFEDYIEADTFEVERFTEIQVATKSLALQVIDFMKKAKLETPKSAAYVAPSSSKFPPLPPLPSTMPSARSPLVSSSSSGTPVPRAASRPRRPPTPVRGERAERNTSPPAVPQMSPDHTVPPIVDPATSGSSSEPLDTMPQQLKGPATERNDDRLNMSSVRSQRSNGTSRSYISQASLGSVELQPPPYTAGESTMTIPPAPQDERHQPPSRDSTPDRLPKEQPRTHSRTASHDDHTRHTLPANQAGTESITNVNYSVFPLPRSGDNNNGTRITAWMFEQANTGPRNQPQTHRQSTRHEPHSLQAIKNLQSLTIPEGKAVGVLRPKHASVIDFSPLTPMLAQLGQFNIDSSTASSPSNSYEASVSQQLRTSPLSQSTSLSSLQNKAEPPLPLKTPDDKIATRLDPLGHHALTPLTLPAAAIDHSHQTQLPPLQLTSETHSSLPHNLEPTTGLPSPPEKWATAATTIISDHASFFTTPSLLSSSSATTQPIPQPQPREADTSISPRSSLYALGGFCPASQRFKSSHQDGIRKLPGHVAGISTPTARCDHCSYGHAFAELDLDVNAKSPRATFSRPHGVLFRIRLLYKSHLMSQRPSEAFYGCLFCAQLGCVTREGDATVFRSSDDLLRHLARHPQPLPDVSGVTVLYGKKVLASDPRVHDFDVWLTEEPVVSPPQPPLLLPTCTTTTTTTSTRGGDHHLALLPVATAGRSHVQRYAEKKLPKPDGKAVELLQFFVGARIVGVEFPAAWAGKWATGWADGEWGCFPAKSVALEKPKPGRLDAPPLLMHFQGTGAGAASADAASAAVSMSVVARWKFDPTGSIRDAVDKEGWIGFDKGERITNVGWPVVVVVAAMGGARGGGREAWCWSGTNSKGKFGVFPRSHVDEGTLRDDSRPGTAMGTGGGNHGRRKKEGGGGKGGKSLFGVRRRASVSSTRSGGGGGGGITEII